MEKNNIIYTYIISSTETQVEAVNLAATCFGIVLNVSSTLLLDQHSEQSEIWTTSVIDQNTNIFGTYYLNEYLVDQELREAGMFKSDFLPSSLYIIPNDHDFYGTLAEVKLYLSYLLFKNNLAVVTI